MIDSCTSLCNYLCFAGCPGDDLEVELDGRHLGRKKGEKRELNGREIEGEEMSSESQMKLRVRRHVLTEG
jgi:hypothetical protein